MSFNVQKQNQVFIQAIKILRKYTAKDITNYNY